MTLALDTPYQPTPARMNGRVAAGIALSLVAHALLLAIYRQPAAPAPTPAPAPPVPLTLRLRPAPPPVLAPAPSTTMPAHTSAQQAQRAERPARAPRAVIAVTPEQRQSDAATYSVKPAPAPTAPPEPAPATPRFDLDAARGMARTLANAPDPDKAGTALERLPPPPLQTENKFERAIKGAKRADCKDGVPGGLFAPLFLAMDKKDSGCKW